MRAMQLYAPGPIEAGDPLQQVLLPTPEPGPGEVRLRVTVCGVCHTDLHLVEGDLPLMRTPLVPGHQVVGRIDALGEGVPGNRLGSRVGLPWLFSTCGRCEPCRRGRENLCQLGRFTGWHADGGYAEHVLADARFVFPLPDGFEDLAAAPLLCGGVIGYRALRLSTIAPGERLGLYGFGNSAHICLQIARHWGCEVFVFTRSVEHQTHARELGAVWAGQAEDDPGTDLHSSIVFAPAGPLVPAALRLLAPGGTLALAGIHMSQIPAMDYRLIYGERTVRSVANATRDDARELLALAAEIPIQTEIEVFDLEQANAALRRVKHSAIRGGAVLRVS